VSKASWSVDRRPRLGMPNVPRPGRVGSPRHREHRNGLSVLLEGGGTVHAVHAVASSALFLIGFVCGAVGQGDNWAEGGAGPIPRAGRGCAAIADAVQAQDGLSVSSRIWPLALVLDPPLVSREVQSARLVRGLAAS